MRSAYSYGFTTAEDIAIKNMDEIKNTIDGIIKGNWLKGEYECEMSYRNEKHIKKHDGNEWYIALTQWFIRQKQDDGK